MIPLRAWLYAGMLAITFGAGFAAEHQRMGAKLAQVQADRAEEARQREQVRADDERQARQIEQTRVAAAGAALQGKQDEIDRINNRYAVQLDGLRNRAARPASGADGMPAPRAACAGATGAELSRDDAALALREAARADTIRAALAQCYAQYESLSVTPTPEK